MFNKKKEEVIKSLKTNETLGLTTEEAEKRLEENGYNELKGKKKESLFVRFLKQFADVLIIILIVAGIISIIAEPDEWIESLIIFVVIIINACVGVYQENKAEKSLEALEKMSAPLCKVIRDGNVVQLNTKNLVVGDIVVIEAGDYIPADARIIEASNLQVDESALTGESVPVEKHADVIEKDDVPLGDKKNMVFSSTFVTKGRGIAIVTKTGMNTEIGKIAGMLISEDNTKTPLQQKLADVAKVIGFLCIGICIVVFVLEYISTKELLESFKSSVALAVAAIPEGLAAVVTIVLSIGVSKMAKRNAIVKKLPAVETLGSTSVVCSDKTGTLTQNKMTVVEVYRDSIKKPNEIDEKEQELLQYFALCCDAKINIVDGVEQRIGDPTETALIEANNLYGKSIDHIRRLADVPFDSDRKMMSVLVEIDNKFVLITKGAPDIVIKNSVNDNLEYALQVNDNMAVRALRVLAVGIRVFDKLPNHIDENLEKDLTFIGLVGMIDPSRPEVKDAITIATKAGIRTIMITGDHITTAIAIAKDLGILKEGQKAISSDDLKKMSDDELFEHIEEYSVYARVAPEDKVRIVKAWKKHDKVVAMTGDGVNDSPALKEANIGCAMGITGTDVAKEAADMILVDDNFATIIEAVKEGRGIYDNIKKSVKYLLSSNMGEVVAIFVAAVISLFNPEFGTPLLAIHLLWINLITDSLPAIGLGMEQADDSLMELPPRPKNEGFFANNLFVRIVFEGVVIGLLALVAFILGSQVNEATGHTMAFMTLGIAQLLHAYNTKSEHSIFNKKTFNNKVLNLAVIVGFVLQLAVIYIPGLNDKVFKFTGLSIIQLLISVGLALVSVVIVEITKLIRNANKKSK